MSSCFVSQNQNLSSDDDESIGYQGDTCNWRPLDGEADNDVPFPDYDTEDAIADWDIEDLSSLEVFRLFLTDDILEDIVRETNRYALQCLQKDLRPKSRARKWKPTTGPEILKFLGIIIIMGIVNLPDIHFYWSEKKNDIYNVPLIKSAMPRDRFLLLLRFVHFANNEDIRPDMPNRRLHKVGEVLDKLNRNFKATVTPGRRLVVDESKLLFRGRLVFRQFDPSKRHRYGIKLYKLCTDSSYTLVIMVYVGEGTVHVNPGQLHSHAVVMKLAEDYLDAGRTLYVDNYYSGVSLAEDLLTRETYVCGTLRRDRRGLPTPLISRQLKKGESDGMICQHGVRLVKWEDRRTVLMLTTVPTHSQDMRETGRISRRPDIFEPEMKPVPVLEYNEAKKGIDVADQLLSYYCPNRKGIKWYRKLVLSALTGIAVTNTHVAMKLSGVKVPLLQTTEEIGRGLIDLVLPGPVQNGGRHKMQARAGSLAKQGRRCSRCFKKARRHFGRGQASAKAKKVLTYCPQCPKSPSLCLPCFNKMHN